MNPTTSQRQAIDSDAKNILVVAGPGSGKTATTVARIQRLIEMQVNPRAIVALTFTNAAADELRKRLSYIPRGSTTVVDPPLGYCGTLHGFALKMLKQHGTGIGFGNRTALIGEEAVADLIEAKAKQLGCKKPLKRLLELKAEMYPSGFEGGRLSDEARVIASYYADLREGGMVDFDTILSEFLRMVKEYGSLRQPFVWPFTHLFVDEVQDSAAIDWDIYWSLPMMQRFFVGDQDQSIYAFRGGRPDLMKLRDDGEIIMLEENFRSRVEICTAAQRLIDHTSGARYPKATISMRGTGGLVLRVPAEGNSGAEAAEISRIVRAESAIGASWNEIAVLARTNLICAEIRDQLKAEGVPVAEGAKSGLPKDWALAKALVEWAANPLNDTLGYFFLLAQRRQMGNPEKIARQIVNEIQRSARSKMQTLHRATGALLMDRYYVGDVGILLSDHQISTETRMRVVGLMRLLPVDADLLQLALAMTQDHGTSVPAETGVTVTTMHGAKGREWDVVILAGFEEEEMVSRSNVDPSSEVVDEARRLAYVAVTRARHRLFITHSRMRKTSWGAIELHRPCRFLEEMEGLGWGGY